MNIGYVIAIFIVSFISSMYISKLNNIYLKIVAILILAIIFAGLSYFTNGFKFS